MPTTQKPTRYTTHLLDTVRNGEEFMLIQRMEGGKLQLLLPPHNTAAVLLADAAAALDMCDYHATVLAMCDRLDGQPSPAMAAKAMASTSRNHTDD